MEKGTHYRLDVETVLEALQRRTLTGTLQAEITRLPSPRIPARAIIDLLFGKVQQCRIMTLSGELLMEGAQARQMLTRLGVLHWEWQEQLPSSVVSGGGITLSHVAIPYFQRDLPPSLMQRLNHSARQVVLLIDGKRSSMQIADLLRLSPQTVAEVFAMLEKEGYLLWREA